MTIEKINSNLFDFKNTIETKIDAWQRVALLITGLLAASFTLCFGLFSQSVRDCFKEFWTGKVVRLAPPPPPVDKYQDKDPAALQFLDEFMKNPAEMAKKLGYEKWTSKNSALFFLCSQENKKDFQIAVSPWMIEYVLDKHPVNLAMKDGYGNTILHFVKSRETLLNLFKREPKLTSLINVQNEYGNTPLIRAVKFDTPEVAYELIDRGAKVDVRGFEKNTALHYADTPELIAKLLAADKTCLTIRNDDGETALDRAVLEDREDLVDELLKHHPDLYSVDEQGISVLHIASSPEMVRKLLDADKENRLLNLRTQLGLTPLHFAALRSSIPVVEELLEQGADLYARDIEGNSVLHTAHDGEIAQILLDAGTEDSLLNSTNHEGNTPLHVAAKERRNFVIYTLLEHDADPFIFNKDGNQAIDLCVSTLAKVKLQNYMNSRVTRFWTCGLFG